MRRFLKKIGCGKSPEPPEHSTPLKEPTSITARPPDLRVEPDVIPDDDGGKVNPQEGMDTNRQLPAPEASTSRLPAIGDSPPIATEGTGDTGGETKVAGAPVVAEKVREGPTLPVGAKNDAEKFGPLKTVLRDIPALYDNREESITVENKVANLLPRIVALEERFDSPPGEVAEQRRRSDLIRLNAIKEQLRSLSEKQQLARPTDHVQIGEDAFQLLEDLHEAILTYQMMRWTMTDNQGLEPIDPAEAEVLKRVPSAERAGYEHDSSSCLRGTRTAILEEIELWTRDFDKPSVYWLNGLAGTGKTTIARTIAERTFADGRLGASFFCSRDFEDRRNLKSIFPTLAVQLARRYTQFRSAFVQLVQSNPGVVDERLCNQLGKLIVQPLANSAISTVIVIDALDECEDEEPASAILSVLGQIVAEVPMVKFFITGRPESHIQVGFRLPLLAGATDVFVLHEVEPNKIKNDIRLFFRHHFSKIKTRRRGLDNWPTEEQVELLCERAAGLFVYAMATVRFIDQKNSSPKKQLDRLLQSQGSSKFERETEFKASVTLDSLYTSILQEAFGGDDRENSPKIRSILGAAVLAANPPPPSVIASLLGLEPEEVSPILSSLASLLVFEDGADQPVRPFHKSFSDFIIDPARCIDPRFRVFPPDHHTELLVGCLGIMNRELERNMCELPDGVTNSEVADLKERTQEHISRASEYACRSWHKHLVDTMPAHVGPILHQFLEKKFLFWLEVLSVLGTAREAVDALVATKCKWGDNQELPTLDLVRDCLRFVIAFFEVISMSAPHIYHSALPLSPQTSIVRDLYKQHSRPMARVVRGSPLSWEPVVASAHLDGFLGEAVWSPCNRFIAAVRRGSVDILDAVTLSRLSTLDCVNDRLRHGLSFSPDSRLLSLLDVDGFISWDLQTGGMLGTTPSWSNTSTESGFSFAHSKDSKVAAAYGVCRDSNNNFPTFIGIYDFFSRTVTGPFRVSEELLIHPIWTHDEHIRFATLNSRSITIWQVDFTLAHPPAEVESLSIPNKVKIVDAGQILFHPALSLLALVYRSAIQIWDAKASEFLLSSKFSSLSSASSIKQAAIPKCSFSSDGRFFTCWHDDREVYVWKKSPAGYALHQQIQFPSSPYVHQPRISPNGESIVTTLPQMLHLSHTRDQILPPPNVPTRPRDQNDFILGFSPDEKFAAFGQEWRNMVTILDLQSGEPRWTADMGVKMECLGMTESTVIVVGEGKIVTWNIPDEACASNASTDDSIRTTVFDHPQPSGHPGEHHATSLSPDLTLVAVVKESNLSDNYRLEIYDVPTGTCLASAASDYSLWLRFTRDGREVRTFSEHFIVGSGWGIVKDSESGAMELNPREKTVHPSGIFFWQSPDGYKVTHDGWVLNSSQKRLLWLPHRWRSDKGHRTWSGRFLGLSQEALSELVVLEFLK